VRGRCNFSEGPWGVLGEEVCGRVERRALRRRLGWANTAVRRRQRQFEKKNESDDGDVANAIRKIHSAKSVIEGFTMQVT